jgi:TonB family protein
MRFMGPFGSVLLWAGALAAQSPEAAQMVWRQFRAPDSTFAVMYHAFHPFDRQVVDSGYVTEVVYTTDAGGTVFAVRRQSHRQGASIHHLPSVSGFCATCLGNVLSDTTIRFGPNTGRWLLVERESADSNSKTTLALRVVGQGANVYVVSAESTAGEPLSPDSGWFLDSFRLCVIGDLCPVVGDGQPPWKISPFRYLPPAGGPEGAVSGGTPNFGQPFLEYQVDQPARALPSSAMPIYPTELRARGVEGEVVVEFVVDTTGRVESSTFKILTSADTLFSDAVRAALPSMKFVPATVGRAKVRQLVQQSYPFKLPH